MAIENLAEDIVLIDVPPEPTLNEELKTATDLVRERGDCHVVLDMSHVDIIASSSLSKLLKLRKLLIDSEHRLMLCSVGTTTRGIFAVTALEGIFEVAEDRFAALMAIEGTPVAQAT